LLSSVQLLYVQRVVQYTRPIGHVLVTFRHRGTCTICLVSQ